MIWMLDMDLLHIGKKILAYLAATLLGLNCTFLLLNYHSSDGGKERMPSVEEMIPEPVQKLPKTLKSMKKIADRDLVSLSLPVVQEYIAGHLQTGTPVLRLVYQDKIYYLNKDLEFVKDSATDAIVLTSEHIQFDLKSKTLAGKNVENTIELIQYAEQYRNIYPRVSEIHIDPEIGWMLYLNGERLLPIVLGRKEFEKKMLYLTHLLDQLGQTELLITAKFIDLRFKDNVIIKKNT